MGIEINGNNGRPRPDALGSSKSQATSDTPNTARGSTPAKTASGGGDQVRLSNQAAQLQALEAQISNLPVVDTQRVQEVQRTIATGSYEVRPAEVADKVITFEVGLGKAP